ncbi:NUMOD4 motif-containing HNH endonuclease [Staphylococcus agnetis]|uniref:NUMOD4 motif-containing HNH endonuclease n=1 Tax=Staphylococcus agnetis TaxID=985762 RepID=UPI000D1BACA7|nr:NUMOD4 motif-containing HNH endonuclease [Staphylococcus agnetis]PTH36721.1 endonuclease [Staphylococcus agnetis]
MKEIWKDVVGYEGLYEVSNQGRIRSKERYVKVKDSNFRYLKSKVLKERITKLGYNRVALYKNSKPANKFVHRLVMEAFDRKSPQPVNHKNGNKTDNHLDNLEYCTHQENSRHAVDIGLINIGTANCEEKIIRDYKNGMKFLQLTKKYHTSYYQLKKVLIENGIEIESRGIRRRKYKYNDSEIFYLLEKGLTEREVANQLNITRNVVNYRKKVKRDETVG